MTGFLAARGAGVQHGLKPRYSNGTGFRRVALGTKEGCVESHGAPGCPPNYFAGRGSIAGAMRMNRTGEGRYVGAGPGWGGWGRGGRRALRRVMLGPADRLRERGVTLTGRESSDELVSLLDAVEEY